MKIPYTVKKYARLLSRKFGIELKRYDPRNPGFSPFDDMRTFIAEKSQPLIIDAGANAGQTVSKLKTFFPSSIIHAFEPSPTTFEVLEQKCSDYTDVACWNMYLNQINHGVIGLAVPSLCIADFQIDLRLG